MLHRKYKKIHVIEIKICKEGINLRIIKIISKNKKKTEIKL